MQANDQALYVAPGSPIKSLADLRHKTIGVNVQSAQQLVDLD
jgi:ABC-type nitrate/sulfonate/bicarbonate transport system substrate-binding protein